MTSVRYLEPRFDEIPAALKSVNRWVLWDRKRPFSPAARRSPASVTDPCTWGAFQLCRTAYEEGGWDGVGLVLAGDGLVGIDLDSCFDGSNICPAAIKVLDCLGAQYVEVSPSGTGLRAFGRGHVGAGRRGQVEGTKVEVYDRARFLTVTGHVLHAGGIEDLHGLGEVLRSLSSPQKRDKEASSNLPSSSVINLFSSVGREFGGFPAEVLPRGPGERNQQAFTLARWLKGVFPDHKAMDLRPIVKEWHQCVLPEIRTKDFAETWGDFVIGWDKVKFPLGASLDAALSLMCPDRPLPTAITLLGYGSAGERLVRICRALQDQQGVGVPFFLSARKAAELLDVDHSSAAAIFRGLVHDGVLLLISRGSGAIASRYRMNEGYWSEWMSGEATA